MSKITRRNLFKVLAAGTASSLPLLSEARPPASECGPIAPRWGKGTEGQRKADLGNGTYLNSVDGIDFAGYLKVAPTSTNDITVIHSGTLPSSYAI